MSRQVKALKSVPPVQEKKKIQKIGCSQFEAEEVASISGGRTAATEKYRALVSKTWERKEHRHKKCPLNLAQKVDVPGGKGLHQFRPSCLKREQLVVGSGSSDFTGATSRKPQGGGLSVSSLRNARVAGCCGASVAPWIFGSGGAAHVRHVCQSLKQIRATAGPIAAASSLELGAVRPSS